MGQRSEKKSRFPGQSSRWEKRTGGRLVMKLHNKQRCTWIQPPNQVIKWVAWMPARITCCPMLNQGLPETRCIRQGSPEKKNR